MKLPNKIKKLLISKRVVYKSFTGVKSYLRLESQVSYDKNRLYNV